MAAVFIRGEGLFCHEWAGTAFALRLRPKGAWPSRFPVCCVPASVPAFKRPFGAEF
jgi:hypothetical protein